MFNQTINTEVNLNLIQNVGLSLLSSSKNKENSESLLRRKRNFLFKIEKNFENKFSKSNQHLPKIGQMPEIYKNNFSSTTNLSKESSGKKHSLKLKKEEERKKIMEKNLVKLYSINSLRTEEKPKLNCKGTKALGFGKKDFLTQIKTKNNFITLNKQLSSDINFGQINFIKPNFSSDNIINDYKIKNKHKNNNQTKKHNHKYSNLAINSDCSLISELKEKPFMNLTNFDTKNSSLFKTQTNFFENKNNNNNNNNNFNGNYINNNKVYNLSQTASLTSLEFGNFTYLNLDLFEKSELYSERVENLQSFVNQKKKEKFNDEKDYLLNLKTKGAIEEDVDEAFKTEDYSLERKNIMYSDNNKIAFKEGILEKIEENIDDYECVFLDCERALDNKKDWEAHYQEHLKE